MSNHKSFASSRSLLSTCLAAVGLATATFASACAESPDDGMPGGTQPAPLDPTGTYSVRSMYSLAAPPALAAPMLAELAAATDGPDDPSRYLIDRLVARVPAGQAQIVAAAVAPYLAAYVQRRIDGFAPELAQGIRSLGDGLDQIARRFGTTELLTVEDSGERARRVIGGLRFEANVRPAIGTPPMADMAIPVEVAFAPLGIGDIGATVSVALAKDRLVFGEHHLELPYGAVLRAGLDHAIVPRVVPGAMSLDVALARLVDCDRLGALVAEYVGIGQPETYSRACGLALVHLAAEIYERLANTATARMTLAGAARVIDLDGDGPVDVIMAGTWSGTVGDAPISSAVFDGAVP